MKNMEQDRYRVLDKCRAVLAVWTERKQASALCRELGINPSVLSQWQDRALSGMLDSLEPRGVQEGTGGPALPPQVKRLLDRKVRARDLDNVGRSVSWRTRPAKTRATPESSSPSAAS